MFLSAGITCRKSYNVSGASWRLLAMLQRLGNADERTGNYTPPNHPLDIIWASAKRIVTPMANSWAMKHPRSKSPDMVINHVGMSENMLSIPISWSFPPFKKPILFQTQLLLLIPSPINKKKTIPQETMLFHIGFAKMGPPNGGDCQFISINSIPLYCTICTIIFRCA